MRDVYNNKSKYSELTQGSIIRGCVADGYENCDVYGCVITARCDLAQSKVGVVHYLPVVSFEDWLKREIIGELRQEWIRNKKKMVVDKLKAKKMPETFIDRNLSRTQIQSSIEANFKSRKEITSFMEAYDNWINSCECQAKDVLIDPAAEGLLKQYLDLLINHGKSEWYMIENWHNNIKNQKFNIILLREIKEITIDCANKLVDGIAEDELSADFFDKNMLVKTKTRESLYYVESEIKSPYIEHILQRFTSNFARIGLDDIPKVEITKQLIEYSKKVLK